MIKKIILINRPLIRSKKGFHVSRRKWQPLNLLYIGTYLKQQNLDVQIIDCRAEDYSSEDIEKILLKKQPYIVLIASDPFDFYGCPNPSMETFYDNIKSAKKSGAKYILSIGPQATVFTENLLAKTALTHIIKGDNPIAAGKLILDLLNNQQTQKIIDSGHLENLDELPVGDYDLLPMEKYSANMPAFAPGKFSIMSTSRGCPFQCKYCFKKLIGNSIRQMSLERIEQELDILVNKYKIQNIYFIDDFFTFNFERIYKLCDILKKYNLKWGCQTRTDSVDENLLKAMQSAGCIYISYGVESGSQKILDKSIKNLKLESVTEIINLTRKLGINAHFNMMYGFPGETKKNFMQSINFMIKNKEYVLPGVIRFYPGCQFYNELIPGKSVKEIEKISADLALSKLKRVDVERGLAKLILAKKIHYKEFDWKILYYIIKYLFPGLIIKFQKNNL
ncbi:B12-binding domain-containing radical SAM protein [Patescibacteria group bacterium]|nr:B12-binding domain-containing radical SAM protein [Patescibacteria group bacterium]